MSLWNRDYRLLKDTLYVKTIPRHVATFYIRYIIRNIPPQWCFCTFSKELREIILSYVVGYMYSSGQEDKLRYYKRKTKKCKM